MRYCFEAAAEHGGGGVREEVQHENFHALIQKPGTILIHRVKGSGSKYPES